VKRSCILAIDQGTTNTKALLVDANGALVARGSSPLAIHFPQPAWVEQDPGEQWRSVLAAVDLCIQKAGPIQIAGVGISNQRETALVWDRRTGQAVAPAIVWQCRRSAPFCESLRAQGYEALLHERTGLGIDPLFSASKLRWLLDHIPNGQARAEAADLCAGTVDSWVLWNLTGGRVHACDATNASRTQLFDLRGLNWDDELLALFGIPRALLPRVYPSSNVFGETVANGPIPDGIPIGSLVGDSHAALFGHGAYQPGTAKATYGTGSSLMTLSAGAVPSAHGLSTTIAWWQGSLPSYALEGNITMTGGAMQWTGDFLRLAGGAIDAAALATELADSEGVYVVPAFAGLGAPHWRADARGLITGLTQGSSAAHLARATLESIAYQVRDVFDAMEADVGRSLPCLLADGGASANDQLMQFQADILGKPIRRNLSADLSAIGAAKLAGLALGFWPSLKSLEDLPVNQETFSPMMAESRRWHLYNGWQQAVAMATKGNR
jgi:glycerol kinase